MGEIRIDPVDGKPQRPMVKREDYDRARAVLDALPSGVYIKCAECTGWKRGGQITMRDGEVLCEVCSGNIAAAKPAPPKPVVTFENAVQKLQQQMVEAQARQAMARVNRNYSGVPPEGSTARALWEQQASGRLVVSADGNGVGYTDEVLTPDSKPATRLLDDGTVLFEYGASEAPERFKFPKIRYEDI